MALAVERATPKDAATLQRRLGDPALDAEGIAELRHIITETGALHEVELMIDTFAKEALAPLELIAQPAREVLSDLAVAATSRRF